MKISVLMSVYNSEVWLSESIESVLTQTYSNFEFIIVNDGSTDGSLKIINDYALKDSRIKVFSKKNTGLADSLNYGIERVSGEWVARIDADDLWQPSKLDSQIHFVGSSYKLVLLGAGMTILNAHGIKGRSYKYPTQHINIVRNLSAGGSAFPHSSAFFKTEIVRQLGGYRKRIYRAEDLDLWLRLSEVGEVASLPVPLVLIRKHEKQISNDGCGRLQIVDSHVAMISYWLRLMKHEDPVKNLTSEEFNYFREWVEKKLYILEVFEYHGYIENLKVKILDKNFIFKILLVFLVVVFYSSKSQFFWIKNKFFGSNLSKKLALDWSNRKN